jgi:hypothetical protein
MDFNLTNGLFPVVDMKDTHPDHWRTEVITITNLSKKNKMYPKEAKGTLTDQLLLF